MIHAAAGLWVVQVAVGAVNVWLTFPDALTVLHTAIATAIWTVLVTTAILWFYRPAIRGPAPLSAAEVPA
jgi:heme A synthase